MKKKIKCVVACRDASGTPVLVSYIVEVTQKEYDNGDHYDKAAAMAKQGKYENIALVFDENDGPEFLFKYFFGNK